MSDKVMRPDTIDWTKPIRMKDGSPYFEWKFIGFNPFDKYGIIVAYKSKTNLHNGASHYQASTFENIPEPPVHVDEWRMIVKDTVGVIYTESGKGHKTEKECWDWWGGGVGRGYELLGTIHINQNAKPRPTT